MLLKKNALFRILTASENFPAKQSGSLYASMGQKSVNGPDRTETSRNCTVIIRHSSRISDRFVLLLLIWEISRILSFLVMAYIAL